MEYNNKWIPVRSPSRSLVFSLWTWAAAAMLLFTFTLPAQAQTVNLELEKFVDNSSSETGATITYTIRYSVASTVYNARNVRITDVLPTEVSGATGDVTVTGSVHTTSATYNSADRTASFIFQDPLPAGSTGDVKVTTRFIPGTTMSGTVANNTATITADNADTTTTPQTPVTAVALFEMTAEKTVLSGGALDEPTTYRIRLCNPNTTGGYNLPAGATMVDYLPANSVYVSSSDGGVYDPINHTVTWTLPQVSSSSSGCPLSRTVTIILPDAHFDIGNSITNSALITGTHAGGGEVNLTPSLNHNIVANSVNATFDKSASLTSREIGQSTTYRFTFSNTGNVTLTNNSITDVVPPQVEVTSINVIRLDASTPANVYYKTNLNHLAWSPMPGNPYSNSSLTSVSVATLGLAVGDYVTEVRFDYATAPVGFAGWSSAGSRPGYTAVVLAVDRNGNPVIPPQTVTNTAAFAATYGATVLNRTDTQNISVVAAPGSEARPRTSKSRATGSGAVLPGQIVDYRLRLFNEAPATENLINPVLADLLDARYEYVSGSWYLEAGIPGAPAPQFEELPNYNGTGRTLLRWSWSGASAYNLPLGSNTQTASLNIRIQLRVKQGSSPVSNLNNTASVVNWDNTTVNLGSGNGSADTNDLNGNGSTTDRIFNATASNITIASVAAMDSYKWVKGQLDTGWNRFPDTGHTVPGGTCDYLLIIKNVGNVSVNQIQLIDILPFIGDHGVIAVNEERGTEWRPNLISEVSASTGVTVEYSTSGDPYRPELVPSGPPGSDNPPNWSTTPPADITSVQSIRFNFGSQQLAPLDSIVLSWAMRAPVGAPTNGEVAWNSFGYKATRMDGFGTLLPAEPVKVGISVQAGTGALLGNFVWNDLNFNGIQDDGEPGVNGVRVDLYQPGPDGLPNTADDVTAGFTFTGDNGAGEPGYYEFPELPVGDYFLKFTPPANWQISPLEQGSDLEKDSNADPLSGRTAVTTLTTSEQDRSWDAGIYRNNTSLGNRVWYDVNRNGIQDSGETGVENVTVHLYDGAGILLRSTVTAADGIYLFDALTPGDYSLGFVLPAGYQFSPQEQGGDDEVDSDANTTSGRTVNTNLAFNEQDLSWDAGIYLIPASVGDRIWIDRNGNGIQDNGEIGLENVTVRLYTSAGVLAGSTTTNSSGDYLFSDLTPGDYFVEVVTPNGYDITRVNQGGDDALDSDIALANGRTATFTLSPGENDLTWDGGFYPLARLGDRIWDDRNINGLQDAGESGVPDVTVQLFDSNDALVATTTTDAQGYYYFENLYPDEYYIKVTLPTGASFSPQDQGGDDSADSDVNPLYGRTNNFTLSGGENQLHWDAGIIYPASVGDLVWLDTNGNGLQDAGENGYPGVTVTLYRENGTEYGNTVTDQDGKYEFVNLPPEAYYIVFTSPSGFIISSADQGNDDTIDSDANPATGQTAVFTLAPGDNQTQWDAGIYQPCALGDYVWYDINMDGIQDTGESGVPNVTVQLFNASNTMIGTTTTDGNGYYQFSNLPAGDYSVQVIIPTGYAISPAGAGSNTSIDSDIDPLTGRTASVTLAPGASFQDLDGGIFELAAIGDRVWADTNGNGVQDAGEEGVLGVTVRLYSSGGALVSQTSTGTGGYYHFTGLVPGDYYLEFSTQTPVAFTLAHVGSDDTDSDAEQINDTLGRTPITTLSPGENDLSWDAGIFLQLAALGDYVWWDVNRNGIQEQGENGIADVQVHLLDGDGQILSSTTTNAGGYYRFDHLAPANYRVQFIAPTGFSWTLQTQGSDPAVDSDADPGDGLTAVVTLGDAEENRTIDAGFYELASIGDYIWYDTNLDGIQDESEEGVAGVTVHLLQNGDIIATRQTDAEGFYLFTALVPGDYQIAFELPPGYVFSPQNAGDDAKDSDADGTTGRTVVTTLGIGEHARIWDAGLIELGSIGDYVWDDHNNDKIQAADELGLPDIRLYLLDADGTKIDSTWTNIDGYYRFIDVYPGRYTVVVDETTLPLSYVTTTFNSPMTVELDPGEHITDADFGYRTTFGSIGDYVWFDTNRDGIQDPDEKGIPGVLIRLLDEAGNTIAKTLTNSDGRYLFRTLPPGLYRVEIDTGSLPADYFLTSGVSHYDVDLSDREHPRHADFGFSNGLGGGCSKRVIAWYEPWYGGAESDSTLRHWTHPFRGGHADTSLFDRYDSHAVEVWEYHILLAWASGIDGFVVDWFGRRSYENIGLHGLLDVTESLWQRYRAKGFDFQIICAYNERALGQLDSNFVYIADSVITHPSYWGNRNRERRPLYIFNWPEIRYVPAQYRAVADTTLPADIFLAWNGTEQPMFKPLDVNYPWVQALNGQWDDLHGLNWGDTYIDYETMRANNLPAPGDLLFMTGAVWPGFDDRPWNWGDDNWIARRDTLVYKWTWDRAFSYHPGLQQPWILIESWNDFNRATQIEPSLDWDYKFIVKTRDYTYRWKELCNPRYIDNLGLLVPQHIHQARRAALLRPQQAAEIEALLQQALDKFFERNYLDAISLADQAAGIQPAPTAATMDASGIITFTWQPAPHATNYVLHYATDPRRFDPCSFVRPDSLLTGNITSFRFDSPFPGQTLFYAITPVDETNGRFANASWYASTLTSAAVSSITGGSQVTNRPANALVFVKGTPTYIDEGWDNAVDGDTEGWDGTTTAINPELGVREKSPWAVFRFAREGFYKFNYVVLQTDNGADDNGFADRQAAVVKVLGSVTGTDDAHFSLITTLRIKGGEERWYPLGKWVVARYVKLVIEEPLYSAYKQIVEFQVQTKDRNGAIPSDATVTDVTALPESFALEQNYPNPFNAETTIPYQLPHDAHVKIVLYDVRGRQVAVLVDEQQSAGYYRLPWRANSKWSSGLYYYRITTDDISQVKSLLYLK